MGRAGPTGQVPKPRVEHRRRPRGLRAKWPHQARPEPLIVPTQRDLAPRVDTRRKITAGRRAAMTARKSSTAPRKTSARSQRAEKPPRSGRANWYSSSAPHTEVAGGEMARMLFPEPRRHRRRDQAGTAGHLAVLPGHAAAGTRRSDVVVAPSRWREAEGRRMPCRESRIAVFWITSIRAMSFCWVTASTKSPMSRSAGGRAQQYRVAQPNQMVHLGNRLCNKAISVAWSSAGIAYLPATRTFY